MMDVLSPMLDPTRYLLTPRAVHMAHHANAAPEACVHVQASRLL